MARVKLEMPERFSFSTVVPVRITDVNYGGHVGNDTVLSLIHEVRLQYFRSLGYSEMDLGGVSVIMSDVAIEFKKEIFYGDALTARVVVGNVTRVAFELYYTLVKNKAETVVALAKTGMVCFDYGQKKAVAVPEEVIRKFRG